MKILIIYHAGAMPNAREIYCAMGAHRGVELTVVAPERLAIDRVYEPTGWLRVEKESGSNGYCLVPLPLVDPERYNLGFENEPLRRVLRQHRPDIVHVWDEPVSHCLFKVAWLRAQVSRKSRVLFYGFLNTPYRWGVLGHLIWKTTWRLIAGGVAANSEALRILSQEGFPKNRPIERVFWGIQTDLFKPMNTLAIKADLGLESEHLVGYIGRLVPEKGLTWLLAAMKQLPPQVHCLVIGSGPMRGELDLWSELPSLSGRLYLLDAKPAEELPRYLNCMDVLAVPSLSTIDWKEQYGRVIAEAMACGVPVVGSDSGAIPEVVDSAGFIVPEGDVSRLAEALQTAIFDKESRAYLIKQALQRVDQELSVKAMSQRLVDFYERILGS